MDGKKYISVNQQDYNRLQQLREAHEIYEAQMERYDATNNPNSYIQARALEGNL